MARKAEKRADGCYVERKAKAADKVKKLKAKLEDFRNNSSQSGSGAYNQGDTYNNLNCKLNFGHTGHSNYGKVGCSFAL